jgi:hypothetical protein
MAATGGGKSGSRVIIWRDRLELTIFRAKTVPRERVLQVRQLDLRHPAYRVASRIIPAGLPQTINMVVAHPPGEEYSGAIHYVPPLRQPSSVETLRIFDSLGYPVGWTPRCAYLPAPAAP